MICPCELCEVRFVGCHAECDAFKAWQAEQAERRKQRYKANAADDFRRDMIRRVKRRQRRK